MTPICLEYTVPHQERKHFLLRQEKKITMCKPLGFLILSGNQQVRLSTGEGVHAWGPGRQKGSKTT